MPCAQAFESFMAQHGLTRAQLSEDPILGSLVELLRVHVLYDYLNADADTLASLRSFRTKDADHSLVFDRYDLAARMSLCVDVSIAAPSERRRTSSA